MLFNNISFLLLKVLIIFFFFSGYDLIFLNDENILFNIFFLIITFGVINFNSYFKNFNKNNKLILLKEYYYKIFLIKLFYITYIKYLKYNYNNYNNYYNYYNNYNILLKTYLINLKNVLYSIFFKFFFNYLNNINILSYIQYITHKYNILINIYYLSQINKFFKKKNQSIKTCASIFYENL